jgi:hypothetical protein
MITSSSSSTYTGGETQRFGDLLTRFFDAILNSLFDLRPQVATIRLYLLIFLFIMSGFVISTLYYPLSVWVGHIQDILGYLLNPNYVPLYPGNPFQNMIYYAFDALTDPHVLQYLPIFLAPFFIALQTAANYLTDVFELEDPGIARHFVSAVALTGSNQVMRITQGNVLESHNDLPIRRIGGPGRVLVDMDSAALFEKPDGTPHVIGPTGKEAGGKASLDGFERFRQSIDLRNQTIELRDTEGRSATVLGRSSDGIPITASDVCFVFTVHRNGQTPSTDLPYPFDKDAIEKLVYKATSQVRPDLPNPSRFEPSWTGGMVGLVRSRLGAFMNDHRLIEYLASFGQPEVDRLNLGEAGTVESLKGLANPTESDLPEARKLQVRPPFIPRDQIKFDLFGPFAADFTKAQSDRGVELYWIGTGTWMVPTEIVPETKIIPPQFIEAWTTSHENLQKAGDLASGYYEKEATVQKFVSLIQEIPVSRHTSATTKVERDTLMIQLLDAYRSQLIQDAEFLKARGQAVPEIIIRAITCISKVIGEDWGWGGATLPDEPENGSPSGEPSPYGEESDRERSEGALYNELVLLLGGDESVANGLIEFEQKQFPKENRRKWIERARDRLLRDRRAFTP